MKNQLRNEFIFLFGDGVSPPKHDRKLRHCALGVDIARKIILQYIAIFYGILR
jgi:hypothetical protein